MRCVISHHICTEYLSNKLLCNYIISVAFFLSVCSCGWAQNILVWWPGSIPLVSSTLPIQHTVDQLNWIRYAFLCDTVHSRHSCHPHSFPLHYIRVYQHNGNSHEESYLQWKCTFVQFIVLCMDSIQVTQAFTSKSTLFHRPSLRPYQNIELSTMPTWCYLNTGKRLPIAAVRMMSALFSQFTDRMTAVLCWTYHRSRHPRHPKQCCKSNQFRGNKWFSHTIIIW